MKGVNTYKPPRHLLGLYCLNHNLIASKSATLCSKMKLGHLKDYNVHLSKKERSLVIWKKYRSPPQRHYNCALMKKIKYISIYLFPIQLKDKYWGASVNVKNNILILVENVANAIWYSTQTTLKTFASEGVDQQKQVLTKKLLEV